MTDSRETELVEVLEEVKPIDISPLLSNTKDADDEAVLKTGRALRECFEKYGVVIIRDPRVTFEKNSEFLNMMEDYFNQSKEKKLKDTRPDLSFQIGATPGLQETARNHCQRIKNMYKSDGATSQSTASKPAKADIETLDPRHKPWTPCPPEADPKWRYFWRLGSQGVGANKTSDASGSANIDQSDEKMEQNGKKEYVMLNATNVVPQGFENWSKLCDDWGMGLLNAARTIAEGVAIGFGLKDRNYFVKRMADAPHLLAPTATDMGEFGQYGTIIAGYHYDLNFITVHGKSRYPGLSIFLRNGQKVRVKVPDGCLLAQAGKQLEWVTGGKIYAGFHEVCVNEATVRRINEVKQENEQMSKAGEGRIKPLWRISSTMFSHMNSNVVLEPIKDADVGNGENVTFGNEEYPPTKASDQVVAELRAIGLHKDAQKQPAATKMELVDKIDNLIEFVEAFPGKK